MRLLIFIIFGIILGSFLNAFVYRLHENTKIKSRKNKLSITKGRSICPSCKHVLGPMDLFPVLSWVFLRGKCRYCNNPISFQYPLVELITCLLFVISYIYWPFYLNGFGILGLIAWLIILLGLIALSIYDFKWMELPNKIVFPITYIYSAYLVFIAIFYHAFHRALISFLAGIVLFALFYALFQLSQAKWIGGGDVKLVFLLGLLSGSPVMAFLLIFVASLLGTLYALILYPMKRKLIHTKIPFGPFLIMATIIVVLFGEKMLRWYSGILG
jgi:leader peptidase (prepilin peptidase)/N-methyltransferase